MTYYLVFRSSEEAAHAKRLVNGANSRINIVKSFNELDFNSREVQIRAYEFLDKKHNIKAVRMGKR